jgi:hypothetical protein
MSKATDDQDLPSGPSHRDKLRDGIFRQRLWIEELRKSADRNVLRRALTDLQRMTKEVEEQTPKRRLK